MGNIKYHRVQRSCKKDSRRNRQPYLSIVSFWGHRKMGGGEEWKGGRKLEAVEDHEVLNVPVN